MTFQATFTKRMQVPGLSISEVISEFIVKPTPFSETIADGAADQQFALAIDISELKQFAIVAGEAMTVKTNSSGAPDDTLVLVKDVPVFFVSGDPAVFSADVTDIFVTNSSGTDGRLDIIAAQYS